MKATEIFGDNSMSCKREAISGGRYLIYYIFEEKSDSPETPEKSETTISRDAPKLEMTEEKNV